MLLIHSLMIEQSLLVDRRANFFLMPANTTLLIPSQVIHVSTFRDMLSIILMLDIRMYFSDISGDLLVPICY